MNRLASMSRFADESPTLRHRGERDDSHGRDVESYEEMQEAMRTILTRDGVKALDCPEYQAAWKAAETIKNRHEGMPPKGAKQ